MKFPQVIIRKNPAFDKCPSCGKNNLKKSHSRNLGERLINRYTPVSIFRCQSCGWRGYKSIYTLTKDSYKGVLVYLILVLLTSVLTVQILKRLL